MKLKHEKRTLRRFRYLLFLVIASTLSAQEKPEQPNIVWIVCEDIGPYIGAYGYEGVKTPNIDQLAQEGVLYTNVYTTAGVCAPSRSAIITGMYQSSIGTMHMRTLNGDNLANTPMPNYSAVIPSYVKCFPEYLRLNGYYCTNNEKQDYQFEPPVTVWDENSLAASWRGRPDNKPFFSVFNLAITHEMNLWIHEKEPLTVDVESISIPPFYPQTKTAAKAIARQLTNIEIMDRHVGEIIRLLKEDGLYENTWIFFYSDHGGALPWMKRELLERGIHIPFMVKHPGGDHAGTVNDELVSGVDFAPTVLSIAGVNIPEHIQGQAFLGNDKSKTPRDYVFAGRDRIATRYDRVRAVSDGRFKYLYNYFPERPYYQDLAFRKSMPFVQEILNMKETGELNPETMKWFGLKPIEELYDTELDPHEMKNLVDDPHYSDKLNELQGALKAWSMSVGDKGEIPEKELLNIMWEGKDQPPNTAIPIVIETDKGLKLMCETEGASIGYQIRKKENNAQSVKKAALSWDFGFILGKIKPGDQINSGQPWEVYHPQKPIVMESGDTLHVNAMRIGFESSNLTFIME